MKDACSDDRIYDGQNLFLLLPGRINENLIVLEEGTGDNLFREDIAEGYVDYVNWNSHTLCFCADGMDVPEAEISPVDGGMVLLRRGARELTVGQIVSAVLNEFFLTEAVLL